jgi:hypothetical protein
MARPGSFAAVLCAGVALFAAGSLSTIPLPEFESPRRFQLTEHITLERGFVSVNLTGSWDSLDADVRLLQRTPRIRRIVIDVVSAPTEISNVAWVEYVPRLQQACPDCEVFVWSGEW